MKHAITEFIQDTQEAVTQKLYLAGFKYKKKKTAFRNDLYWHPFLLMPWLILTLKEFENRKRGIWNGITLIITHLDRQKNQWNDRKKK